MSRLVTISCVIFFAAACEQDRSPTMPPTMPSPSPSPPVTTLSGTVYEHTMSGPRPLAGAPIDVSVEYQSQTPKVISDADGRYTVSGLSPGLKAVVEMPGYSQPCRTPVGAVAVVDLHVVSNSLLATAGIPASLPVVEPTLSGRVFEQTPEGPRSISGADVVADFSGGMGWAPSASTVTDANGRYLLCNVRDVRFGVELWVTKRGYESASRWLDLQRGVMGTIDVELTHQ